MRETRTDAVGGPLTLRTRDEGATVVVEVAGDVGADSAPSLRACLQQLVAQAPGRPVVLDLSQSPFIDSTGLGVVVRGHKAVRAAGGRLSLVVVKGPVRRVLEMSGLDRVLQLDETLDEALRRSDDAH